MNQRKENKILTSALLAVCLITGPTASASVPEPFIFMYGHHDGTGVTDHFRTFMPPFTAIEGTSANAAFIKELRAQGKVYAAHVTNPTGESAAQLLARWRAPFNNTLGGQLPGGYDAIAIDELHGGYTNGSAHSNAVVSALSQLRALYPTKQIYAAATWHYGSAAASYSDQLSAVYNHADMLMLECYIREGNPSYGWLTQWADNLQAAVSGILNKTVYGLYIPDGAFVADDTTNLGFWGHLDEQLHRIRNDADASTMPGVMFWVYYQSDTNLTPNYCARLVDHYFTRGHTSYFGDGSNSQLISNPQFETNTSGWIPVPAGGGSVARFSYASVGIANDHDSNAQSSHGSYGLQMTRGTGVNKAIYQPIGLDVNKTYTVSAWVISNTGTTNRAAVTVTKTDGTLITKQELTNVGSAPDWINKWNEWSRISFHFVPPAPSVKIILSDHYTNPASALYWDFVELEDAFTNHVDGDLEPDGDVDPEDMKTLAAQWLQTGDLSADIPAIGGDGTVNLIDFARMSRNWLTGVE